MVAATIRRHTTFSGVRPLDVTRDLAGVADLLAISFVGEMDVGGERAVNEMRAFGRLGPLAWWMELFVPVGDGFAPGFVYVDAGRVVGNATVRRAPAYGRGHIIVNVAVLPEYRGHGIARQLMEACIARAREDGSSWVALEVRVDNTPARHLYQSLGFRQTGAVAQLLRAANAPLPETDVQVSAWIRKPRAGEEAAVLSLAQSATPEGLRWAEPLRESEFVFGWDRKVDLWLSGRSEAWWVVESEGKVVGAIEAEMFRSPRGEGRLRMWVAQGHRFHGELIQAALGARQVASRTLQLTHPAEDVDALRVFEQYGFRPARMLAHMKLNLR
jgi:ribosomal protein S18 acetylase RimI-like enzyme